MFKPVSLILFFVIFSLVGCASPMRDRQIASAAKLPCPADDIKVTRLSSGIGYWTWLADCNGITYKCSANLPGDDTLRNVGCSPAK